MKEKAFKDLVLRALLALTKQVLSPNSVVPDAAKAVQAIQAELQAAQLEESKKHAK